MKTNVKIQETGRSMVEMLGVLAIIGVLSVGGIAGYTMAMNKHKANEILNAASVRAMVVSTQIQNGSTSPTLAEFTDNKVGSATFGTDVKNTAGTGAWTKGTDNQFSLTLSGVDTKVCDQMKNIAGESSIIKAWGDNCAFLTYNNDLGNGTETGSPKNGWTAECDEDCTSKGTGWKCVNGTCTNKTIDCSSCDGDNTQFCAINGEHVNDCSVITEGSCVSKPSEDEIELSIGATKQTFYLTKGTTGKMNWWSAQNYCNKFHNGLVSLSDIDFINYRPGATYENSWTNVRAKFGSSSFWVQDADNCVGYRVGPHEYVEDVDISPRSYDGGIYVLCK